MHPHMYNRDRRTWSPDDPAAATPPSPTPASPSADPPAAPAPADPPAPAADPPAADPPAADPPAADPAAVKPENADGYTLNFADATKTALGDLTNDPALKAVRDMAFSKGWTQAQFDDRIGVAVDALAEAGLLLPAFNPQAEIAKLGENGPARMQEAEVFAKSLFERKELSEGERNELMSLVPTANGVTLIEKLRAMMGTNGTIQPPTGAEPGADQVRADVQARRLDPRYETEPAFRQETDRMRMQAYGKKG